MHNRFVALVHGILILFELQIRKLDIWHKLLFNKNMN